MIIIVLSVLLAGAICWAFYERGVANGVRWDAEEHTRTWNNGFDKARSFYETPETAEKDMPASAYTDPQG